MEEKERRQYLLAGLGLLTAVGAGAAYSCMLPADQPMVPTTATAAAENDTKLGSRWIEGLDQADSRGEIRNPFSVTHETEAEGTTAPIETREKQEAVPEPQAPAASRKTTQSLQPPPSTQTAPAVAPVLCGVAGNAQGRLALLRLGNETLAVGAGEWAGAWQVRQILETAVVLHDGTDELVLPLAY